jgi:RNA polymerase sigma factor (sigma-70 family)
MAELPGTRASLLIRLRDPDDREAWRQFVALYAPLIHGLARKRGLQDADAADLTQEVLQAVAGAVGRLDYDPARGTFRGWLYTIARRRIHDFLDSRQRREQGSGDSATLQLLEEQPAQDEESQRWERDYRQHVFNLAAEQVRGSFEPATWQAFWLLAVEGMTGAEAARVIGLSVAAVYVAKSRVLARLKQRIQDLEAE